MTDGAIASQTPEGATMPDVATTARAALHKTGHGWLQRVVVMMEGEVVILRGTVPSYYLKQVAQVTVMSIAGASVVRNELRVEGDNR